MKKSLIRSNHTLYDVAPAGPVLLTQMGIPALAIFVVIVLVVVAVKLIKKANQKNKLDGTKNHSEQNQ